VNTTKWLRTESRTSRCEPCPSRCGRERHTLDKTMKSTFKTSIKPFRWWKCSLKQFYKRVLVRNPTTDSGKSRTNQTPHTSTYSRLNGPRKCSVYIGLMGGGLTRLGRRGLARDMYMRPTHGRTYLQERFLNRLVFTCCLRKDCKWKSRTYFVLETFKSMPVLPWWMWRTQKMAYLWEAMSRKPLNGF